MESLLWWHWILFGVALVILKNVIPIVSIFWFGLGAIFVGILLAIFPGMPPALQMMVFGFSSILFVIIWTKFIEPRRKGGKAPDQNG
jgi:inner membrane protein